MSRVTNPKFSDSASLFRIDAPTWKMGCFGEQVRYPQWHRDVPALAGPGKTNSGRINKFGVSAMTDPSAIHQWVREFNWDDDLAPMWPIVESADTDFVTALLIYWRLDGPWILRSGSNSEAVRLHDAVVSRLLAGAYGRRWDRPNATTVAALDTLDRNGQWRQFWPKACPVAV